MPEHHDRPRLNRTVLRDRSFRLLFAGNAASAFGDRIVPVALAFGVLELTGSVSDLGIVLAAQTIPLLLFVLVGGALADRLPRRSVMLTADAVRALTQGASAVLLLTGEVAVWQLALLQAFYGTATAFFVPASTAMVPDLVAADDLQDANAWMGLGTNVSSVLGPAAAGVIVAASAPGWALAIDAVTFVASATLLGRLTVERSTTPEAGRFLTELGAGWQVFRSQTWLWVTAAYFALFLAVGYSPLQVVGPDAARAELGGAGAWAVINVARGVGALLGGAVALRRRPRHPLRAAFLLFLIATPTTLVLLGLGAPLPLILVFALLDGAAASFFNAVWFTAVQRRVPREHLSRVAAWDALGGYALLPVGQALSGPIAAATSTSTTLIGAGGVTLVLIVVALAVPSVRNLDGARGRP